METIKDKTPEQQADEIVEMFRSELLRTAGTSSGMLPCAILHVTGIIEVLWNIDNVIGKDSISILPQINHYQQILTILKSKL